MRRRPALKTRKSPPGGRPERDELGVLDPPATGKLFDDQLRIEQQMDLASAELTGERKGAHHSRVLGDVVRLDPQVVGDRGVRHRTIVTGVGSRQGVQRSPEGRRARVAAGGTVGANDETQPRDWGRATFHEIRIQSREERIAQSDA